MRTIQELLLALGCARALAYAPRFDQTRKSRLPGSSFWTRNAGRLDELLADLQRQFRRQIKRAHTDRSGDHARAAAVNDAWREVKRRFKLRGIEL